MLALGMYEAAMYVCECCLYLWLCRGCDGRVCDVAYICELIRLRMVAKHLCILYYISNPISAHFLYHWVA